MPIRTLEPGRFFAAERRRRAGPGTENVPENDDHTSSDALERRLFELASDALVITALDGTIRRANPAALELLDARRVGVIGQLDVGARRRGPTRARAAAVRGRQRGSAHVAVEEFRLRVVRPGGDVRWAEVRASIDAAAGLCHIVARDITDRDEADAERLGQAFRDSPTGIALVNVDGTSGASTPRSREMLGTTEERLLGDRASAEIAEDPDSRRALGAARRSATGPELVRARGAPAPRRRQDDRHARQRHARARPLRRAALLLRAVPGRHRADRGAGRAGRQRGQARRGPAGRAAGQLGVGDRRGPRHLVGRAVPHPRPAAGGHRAPLRAAPRAHPSRRPRRASRASSRSRSARAATSTSTTASCAPTATRA